MTDIEKKMLKIGLDILKNNPKCIATNVEINTEKFQDLITEGEKLLGEDLDDIEVSPEDLKEIMDIMSGKKEL